MNKIRSFLWSKFGQDIPLTILETTEACWPNEAKRPQIHKKTKTSLGWDILFSLPVGMCYKEFVAKAEYFRDAIGDVTTECQHVGKLALLKIITNRIGDMYEYDYRITGDTKMILPIPIGYTHAGLLIEDLSQIPHILIGGVTRSGKSNFIHSVVASLSNLPTPPKIIIIDLKGLEYEYLSDHVLLASDGKVAGTAIFRILEEMRNRIQILKQAKCVNITKFHKQGGKMEYIVMIIDELAEIKNEDAQEQIETLSALSAATGICLIMATQRPDQHTFKHFGRTKSNLLGRLCFRMADSIGSRIILDNDMASKIPNYRGRAIWKFNDPVELQVPFLDPKIAEERLYEQSAKRSAQGCFGNTDRQRVGGNDDGADSNSFISLSSGGPKKIAQTLLSKAIETVHTNKPLQLLSISAKRYFKDN